MSNALEDEPRSFRLGRGPSDLWVLLAALAFGAVLIVAPAAGPWMTRAALIVAVFLLWQYILSVRRLGRAAARKSSPGGVFGTTVALGVIGFWIWYLARGFLAGKWIDAALSTLLVAQVTYLAWLKGRRGPSGE